MKIAILVSVALVAAVVFARHPAMRYDKWHNDYAQSFVSKIFIKPQNRPYATTTLDQCRDIICRTWEVSGGIHQIIYLVGWQHDGHDSKFPDWSVVGPQCRSSWSDDPLTSLRMLMREAREKWNCDVSLHLNMNDAHPDSPLWQTYSNMKLLCYDKSGNPRFLEGGDGGHYRWARISHVKEWKSGLAKKRIDALLEMIPELKDARSVHIDAFFAQESPFDGITIADDKAAIAEIVDYWHSLGIDVTNEFITSLDQIGLFPMVYHYNLDEAQRMRYPVEVVAPGDDVWNVRMGRDYFGSKRPIHGPVNTSPASGSLYEKAWGLGCFCDLSAGYLAGNVMAAHLFPTAFLFAWYNRHPLLRHVVTATDYRVERKGNVVANVRMADGHLTVTENGRTLVDGGDYFLDETWGGGVILAYSAAGCDRDFTLPQGWLGVTTLTGISFPSRKEVSISVNGGKVRLTLAKGESLVLAKRKAK